MQEYVDGQQEGMRIDGEADRRYMLTKHGSRGASGGDGATRKAQRRVGDDGDDDGPSEAARVPSPKRRRIQDDDNDESDSDKAPVGGGFMVDEAGDNWEDTLRSLNCDDAPGMSHGRGRLAVPLSKPVDVGVSSCTSGVAAASTSTSSVRIPPPPCQASDDNAAADDDDDDDVVWESEVNDNDAVAATEADTSSQV